MDYAQFFFLKELFDKLTKKMNKSKIQVQNLALRLFIRGLPLWASISKGTALAKNMQKIDFSETT